MVEEEKKPEESYEKKENAAPEAAMNPDPDDGKKKKPQQEATPPPPEIVLRVFMHCEGCARKIRSCLKGFQGVEEVKTDCRTSQVTVKGEKADPLKVLERVQRKSHRKVELISPIPTPPPPPEAEEEKAKKEAPKPEEKKEKPPTVTVVLGVYMHCEACAQEIKKRILRMKGVESAEADLKSSRVTVKGVFESGNLVDYVHRRTGKQATIVNLEAEKKRPKEDKKTEEAEKEPPKKPEESGDSTAEKTEDPKLDLKKNEFFHHHPLQQHAYPKRFMLELEDYNHHHAPQMFSDENPNACHIM